MRLPSFKVRTLMIAIGVGTLLVWGSTMGYRSYVYSRLAAEYAAQERSWRRVDGERLGTKEFRLRCVEYFDALAGKYRRATWRPWDVVAPDPHAPGYDEWLEQERRAREAAAAEGRTAGALPAQSR